jgi:hypothetical protein
MYGVKSSSLTVSILPLNNKLIVKDEDLTPPVERYEQHDIHDTWNDGWALVLG